MCHMKTVQRDALESQGPPRSYGVVRGEVTEMYALLVGALQARDHHSPMVLFVER